MDLRPSRNNCLNTVRLIAAVNVMYGHLVTHLGVTMPRWLNLLVSYFRGVPIFYVLSGFLIWQSVARAPSPGSFLKKRFWRIYPELWCGVAVGLVTILCLYDAPIQWPWLGLFALTQSTFLQFWTPDFLRGYGCGTPNGTLGTICVLVQFYLVAWWLYKALHGRKAWVWILLLVGAVCVSMASVLLKPLLPIVLYKLFLQTLIPCFWLFLLGMLAAEWKDRLLPGLCKWWPALLILSALIYLYGWDLNARYGVLRSTSLCLGLLGFAHALPKLNVKTDISYGIFIYHMIVANAMIALGFVKKPVYLLFAAVLSLALAWLSTKTVGKFSSMKKQSVRSA